MKQITKIAEPNSLVQHRATPYATYDNMPIATKDTLRANLLTEQGYICCYCNKRIPESTYPNMKVEHHRCQANNQHLQLSYSNLLAACLGNEGKPNHLLTCDTKKADLDLSINPIASSPNCESLFKYNPEGEISSINDDAEINRQLKNVLNLNMQTLMDNRREIYLEVQARYKAESKRTKNNKAEMNKFFAQEKNYWEEKTDGKYKPYCSVALYFINKKIRANQ